MTVLCSVPEFVYRRMAVDEPFGRGRADHHPLAEIVADVGADWCAASWPRSTTGAVRRSPPGEYLPYALLVAVGARSEPAFRRVLTWTPETDAVLLGGLMRDLDAGFVKPVAFVVPPGVA